MGLGSFRRLHYCALSEQVHVRITLVQSARIFPSRFLHWSLFLLLNIHNMATDSMDPEKGIVSATARSAIPSWTSSAPDNAMANEFSKHTPLQLFQLLVGIYTPPSLAQDGIEVGKPTESQSGRARAKNIGLYQRAKEQERSSRIAYLCTSFISNTLFMLQILLAATFTALSSYKSTHPVTLTVLGAVNTVFAG